MARSDDLTSTLVREISSAAGSGEIKFHQGLVLSWNSTTGANVVSIAGTDVPNVPVLSSAGLVALAAGDPVMVLRYKSKYFIVGRVFAPGAGLVQPMWPIVMYPKFVPVGTPGTHVSDWSVNAGVTTKWEGRARISHPRIEVDGVWGCASGVGTITYCLKVNNVQVGPSWSFTNSSGIGHGSFFAGLGDVGFDVSAHLGEDWRGISVDILSNTCTGQGFFQILGVFFRQT